MEAGMEPLANVVKVARSDEMVVSKVLPNGYTLIVCPDEDVWLVGLGYGRNRTRPVDAEAIFRKRMSRMERYGQWLPVVTNDGGWFVVKRIIGFAINDEALGMRLDEFSAAVELLS